MSLGRVAVVSPREERRSCARAWAPLLHGWADLSLWESPDEAPEDADVVVLDEECDDLDAWLADAQAGAHATASIVVFGTSGESDRGAVPWGQEGAEVLTTISSLLERRRLLEDSDEFLDILRESNSRLDEQRRRFARMVLDQAEGLRGANESLSQEVDRLTRLQVIARFFAAPGPEDTFAERLIEVIARALGAAGAALFVQSADSFTRVAAWKLSWRNAEGIRPDGAALRSIQTQRPSTRKAHAGCWVPLAAPHGVALLFRADADRDVALLREAQSLLNEGLRTRAEARAGLERLSVTERVVRDVRGGLMKIDARGTVVLANPALAGILGREVAEVEGRALEEVLARDEHLIEYLQSPAGEEIETYVTRPSGRPSPVIIRASRHDGSDGEPEVLVLVSDLSQRQEIEAEVRRADRLAAMGRLSAGVAHEIRNPLAGIRTTAELLRRRVESDPELLKFVDVILEEGTRLDRIVGSLLQFAKPAPPQLTALPIAGLLERVSRLASSRAAERGVTLKMTGQEGVRSPLADHDQILQVLLNVALNAVEASPEGGVVRLGAEEGPDGRSTVLFVEDEGEGVPATLRDRVFDPFFTTKPGGTGLGLSISQNIVTQHGGTLRFEAGPEGPNRVLVTLPWSGDREDRPGPEGRRRWQAS